MKSPKSKKDLIEKAVEQIKEDVHCGEAEAIEELLRFIPVENLIAYLPEQDWKPFGHLVVKEYLDKEEDVELRTENALNNLIKKYPNDSELGKEIRKRYARTT